MRCNSCLNGIEQEGMHTLCCVCSKPVHTICAVKKDDNSYCDKCYTDYKTGKLDKKVINVPTVIRRSHIETYKTCPFKFKHEVIEDNPQPPNIYTQLGIDLHDMFDEEGKTGKYGLSDAMKKEYLKLFEAYPDDFFERVDKEKMRQRAITCIETYYSITSTMRKQFASEVQIHFSVGDHLPKVRMTFDRINENSDGGLDVYDWKTGSVMVGKKLSSDLQAPLYIKGIMEYYKKRVDSFTFLYLNENKERTFKRVDDLNYVCTVGKREYMININDAIKEVQRLFSRIQKGHFSIPSGQNMHFVCKYCHIKEDGKCQGADVQAWKETYKEDFNWVR